MKECTKCGAVKCLTEFHTAPTKPFGVRSACKECTRRANLAAYRADKSSHRKAQKAYALRRYGITEAEYIGMFERQGHACAICGAGIAPRGTSPDKSQTAHLDHCHTTGRVRGLLCAACNIGLGKFRDDATLMARAITYLEGNL